jgi:hypothetical protein
MTMKNVGQKLKNFAAAAAEVGARNAAEMGALASGWAIMLPTVPSTVGGFPLLSRMILLYGMLVLGEVIWREVGRHGASFKECLTLSVMSACFSGFVGMGGISAYDSWVENQQSPISYVNLEKAKADIVARCPELKDEANVGDYAWKIIGRQTLEDLDQAGAVDTEKRIVARIEHDVFLPARPDERPRVRHDTTDVTFVRQGDGTCLEMK